MSVPPLIVRVLSVTGIVPRLSVPEFSVTEASAVKTVPSARVRLPSLLMLVRLAKPVACPAVMPLKSSVPQELVCVSVVPTLVTLPANVSVEAVQQAHDAVVVPEML